MSAKLRSSIARQVSCAIDGFEMAAEDGARFLAALENGVRRLQSLQDMSTAEGGGRGGGGGGGGGGRHGSSAGAETCAVSEITVLKQWDAIEKVAGGVRESLTTMEESVHKIGQAQERAAQLNQDDYGQVGVECLNDVARDMKAELLLREQLVNCMSVEDDSEDASEYRVMVNENGEKGTSIALLESVRKVWEDSVCLNKEDLAKLKKIMDEWETPL